jgi:DNA adenine methylase
MNDAKHESLALWLKSGVAPHWLLTYDDHPLVRENFKDCDGQRIQVLYSLARRRAEKELLYMSAG